MWTPQASTSLPALGSDTDVQLAGPAHFICKQRFRKRTKKDLRKIPAFSVFEKQFDLAETYDLSKGGEFTIEMSGNFALGKDDRIIGYVPYRSNRLKINVDGAMAKLRMDLYIMGRDGILTKEGMERMIKQLDGKPPKQQMDEYIRKLATSIMSKERLEQIAKELDGNPAKERIEELIKEMEKLDMAA